MEDSSRDTAATGDKIALVVMGVSGSGKTTVAELLAARLGWTLAEADDFHSPANKEKMAAGVALSDEDRAPWLAALREWIDRTPGNVIITCSALRRRYRDVLREATAEVIFLHLDGTAEEIAPRMADRRGHFMPTSLLASQIATLEPLQPDEGGVVLGIGAAPAEIATEAVRRLGLDAGRPS